MNPYSLAALRQRDHQEYMTAILARQIHGDPEWAGRELSRLRQRYINGDIDVDHLEQRVAAVLRAAA